MKIAIMQPAFIPPASYFRLFAATDMFVIFDTAQFNRRWFTHRQRITTSSGNKEWLTLPIKKTSRDDTTIADMEWAEDYQELWSQQLDKLGDVGNFPIPDDVAPLMFLCNGLLNTCEILGISSGAMLASSISIPQDLRAQDRIVALCKAIGATEYINTPGGKSLYNAEEFARNNIKLTFLPEYKGSGDSVMERLPYETVEEIRREMLDNI